MSGVWGLEMARVGSHTFCAACPNRALGTRIPGHGTQGPTTSGHGPN